MTATTSRRRSTTRTSSPASPGRASSSATTRTSRLACLQIYNDWMIDEWCAGAADGRLIPLTLVPLWDPELAAEEVRRCAAKGSYAIAFSENPSKLGFPSLYTGEWDVLWAACEETEHDGVDAHRLVVVDADDVARRPARHLDVALRAERPGVAVRLGVLRHARSASPTSRSPTPRARSAGCRSSSSAWTPSGTTVVAASAAPRAAERARARAGCSAASSTTCSG